jgi:hypothetical protein
MAALGPVGAQSSGPVIIPTYFHVVHKQDGTGNVSIATVHDQIAVLNDAFKPTGFQFELLETTRTANDAWATGTFDCELEMKAALREGTAETLNLYSADFPELLGWATLPAGAQTRARA